MKALVAVRMEPTMASGTLADARLVTVDAFMTAATEQPACGGKCGGGVEQAVASGTLADGRLDRWMPLWQPLQNSLRNTSVWGEV